MFDEILKRKTRDRGFVVYARLGEQTFEAEVYYSKGGYSYWTYKTEPRGYYLAIRPVEIGDGFVSYMVFSGLKKLLEETKRFSKKRLGDLAAEILRDDMADERIATLLEAVLNKQEAQNG